MNERLQSALRKLRLSGLAESLQVRLEEAPASRLTHAEFLELILQDELAVRGDRQIQRRTKAAAFRELKTLDQFDFSFNPSINKQQIYDLATCRFIREAKDVLWLGPAGRGKVVLGAGPRLPGDQVAASSSTTARSSTWSATSCRTKRSAGQDKVLAKYLKPDLLIDRRHGDEATSQPRAASSCSRSSCGATNSRAR